MPISSHIAANIKSLSTTGTVLGIPFVNPLPKSPHVVMAKSEFNIWYPPPSISAQGFLHAATLTLTWENKWYASVAATLAAPIPAKNNISFDVDI